MYYVSNTGSPMHIYIYSFLIVVKYLFMLLFVKRHRLLLLKNNILIIPVILPYTVPN